MQIWYRFFTEFVRGIFIEVANFDKKLIRMNSQPIESKYLLHLQVSELWMLIEKSLTTNKREYKKERLDLTNDMEGSITSLTGQNIIDIICAIKYNEHEQNEHSNLDRRGEFDGIELLSRHDVARYFKVSLVTLDKWQKNGLIPKAIKIGGVVYYVKSEIEAFLKSKNQSL